MLEEESMDVQPPSIPKDVVLQGTITEFLNKYYPGATTDNWESWEWQLSNSIVNKAQLERFIDLTDLEKEYFEKSNSKKFRVTPFIMKLIVDKPIEYPLRKMFIPSSLSLLVSEDEQIDSLEEDKHNPTKHIVHKYPDRLLFLVTNFCAVGCQFCTRSRKLYTEENTNYELDYQYIRDHKEIRDVIISGGDPLTLNLDVLEGILKELYKISHIEIIRIGTKVPIVLPQRILEDTTMNYLLHKYSDKLWININICHPDELTPEAIQACKEIAKLSIPLGSQTVLLKDINDSTEVMTALMHKILTAKVRPLYLYACDKTVGSEYMRTSVEKGIEISLGLQGHTSSLAIPRYVIDTSLGKIPVDLGRAKLCQDGAYFLENYSGEKLKYK